MFYLIIFYCVLHYCVDAQNISKGENFDFLNILNPEFKYNTTSNRVTTHINNKVFPSTDRQVKRKLKNEIYLDKEWNVKLEGKKEPVPPLMMELFDAMDNDKVQLTKKSETIRCFYGTKHTREEILFFNVTNVNTYEEIVDSELVIASNYFVNGTSGFYRDIIIRLYQILPNVNIDFNNTINADQHQLLTVSYANVIKTSNQIFKMKQAVINWLRGAPNLGLLITVSDINDDTKLLPLTTSDKQLRHLNPFLICYFRSNNRKEVTSIKTKNTENNIIETNGNSCNKKPLFINFEEIGWNNFIIKPRGFMANICSGTCSLGSPNFINYVKLLSRLRILEHVHCVPDQLDFLTLMFYDSSYNIVIKKYRDMIVRTCSCK